MKNTDKITDPPMLKAAELSAEEEAELLHQRALEKGLITVRRVSGEINTKSISDYLKKTFEWTTLKCRIAPLDNYGEFHLVFDNKDDREALLSTRFGKDLAEWGNNIVELEAYEELFEGYVLEKTRVLMTRDDVMGMLQRAFGPEAKIKARPLNAYGDWKVQVAYGVMRPQMASFGYESFRILHEDDCRKCGGTGHHGDDCRTKRRPKRKPKPARKQAAKRNTDEPKKDAGVDDTQELLLSITGTGSGDEAFEIVKTKRTKKEEKKKKELESLLEAFHKEAQAEQGNHTATEQRTNTSQSNSSKADNNDSDTDEFEKTWETNLGSFLSTERGLRLKKYWETIDPALRESFLPTLMGVDAIWWTRWMAGDQ
jgi:hypothetical protein